MSPALTSPPAIAVKSSPVPTPSTGDKAQISSVLPGSADQGAPQSAAPSIFGGGPGGGSVVPPLTESQRKIVHEFKQRMAQLPPDKQSKFITENKAALIKQLNFQPQQLQMLRSNHLAHQQQQRLQQQQQQQHNSWQLPPPPPRPPAS